MRSPCTWPMPSSRRVGTSTWTRVRRGRGWTSGSASSWPAPLFRTRRELGGNGQTLHFHATDPDLDGTGQWLVARTPSGITVEPGHAKADVAVRVPAARPLLLLTRRLPASEPGVEISGEQALLTRWLEHTPF
jgi:hypothetical protein